MPSVTKGCLLMCHGGNGIHSGYMEPSVWIDYRLMTLLASGPMDVFGLTTDARFGLKTG